tara:strand:+ start:160 stop:486 length:327 start_codon:yes stop_codon:yes gene_type:complete
MIALNKNVEEKARQEDELKGLDDVEKVYRGYTQKELHIAFNLVANKSNWKDPTSTKISEKNLAKYREVIEAAVIFYTGSCAEFVSSKDSLGRTTYWCEFDGYYMCIGS